MPTDDDRLRDGRRIAQLLASELDGRADRGLDRLAVTDADPDVDPTSAGARAFDVTQAGDHLATVLVQPEQVLVALPTVPDAVATAAAEADLEIDSEAAPARLVVPDGAAVKRAVPVLRALSTA